MDRDKAMLEIAVSSYAEAKDDRQWLAAVLRAAAPRLDAGLGLMGWTFRPPHFLPENVVGIGGGEQLVDVCLATTAEMAAASKETLSRAFTAPRTFETASELARRTLGVEVEALPGFVAHAHAAGVRDFTGVRAMCPSGAGLCLGAPMPAKAASKRAEREAWRRPAAHLLAGLRLRLAGQSPSLDTADAVLAPGGQVLHVANHAIDERRALRRAAEAFDHARSQRGRTHPSDALQAFQALVSGRWSLVDLFDSDGRRFLVARRNDPDVPDMGPLSRRQTQIACYTALGHPLKYIAYELGLPVSTVGRDLGATVHKLGLRSSAELAGLLAPFAAPHDDPAAR